MTSITKFNKPILDLYSNVIQEFIDKLKINIPDDYHALMDEQFKKDIEVIKLNIKNTNKINNKNNKDKDAPKKPARANCWRLFCAEKSKELTDVPQNEKWALLSKEWEELKTNGGHKYWKDLADKLNSEISDDTNSDTSDTTPIQEDEDEQPEPEPKPTKPKAKAKAPKKAKKTNKKTLDNSDDDDNEQHPELTID